MRDCRIIKKMALYLCNGNMINILVKLYLLLIIVSYLTTPTTGNFSDTKVIETINIENVSETQ